MTLSVFRIKQGARAETLFYEVGYSLAGYTDPRFSMRNRQTGLLVLDRVPAVICNGTFVINGVTRILTPVDGIAYYAWGATDLDSIGNYDAEFRFTDAGGKFAIEPPGNAYITILIGDAL